MNKQVVLDVILKKKIMKGIKIVKKVCKVVSQIYHLNLDPWSRQSNNLNEKDMKEKCQTPAICE